MISRADDGNRTRVLSLKSGSSSIGRWSRDLRKRAFCWLFAPSVQCRQEPVLTPVVRCVGHAGGTTAHGEYAVPSDRRYLPHFAGGAARGGASRSATIARVGAVNGRPISDDLARVVPASTVSDMRGDQRDL